ncbi:MAG: hypothetical protein WC666_03260 [Candidatus Paceibacterota bacterium]|jgi:hypothetical protein
MFVIRTQFGKNFLYWNNILRKWVNTGYSEFITIDLAQTAELNIPVGNAREIIEVI